MQMLCCADVADSRCLGTIHEVMAPGAPCTAYQNNLSWTGNCLHLQMALISKTEATLKIIKHPQWRIQDIPEGEPTPNLCGVAKLKNCMKINIIEPRGCGLLVTPALNEPSNHPMVEPVRAPASDSWKALPE